MIVAYKEHSNIARLLSDSSLSLSASSVLLVSPQSSSMASAMSMKASPVHPPKITTVKALVESTGSSSIPSFYNFTPYLRDEPVAGDAPIAGDAKDSIPIIDISLLVSGTPEEQSQIIHQLSKACSDWGCFMVQFILSVLSFLLIFSLRVFSFCMLLRFDEGLIR